MTTENINPALQPLARPIEVLKEDPRNARRHDQRSVDAIAESLTLHGQQKPVVALKDGTVIAGNGTLQAARSLGWGRLAAVVFEDASRARAYALADNRTAELSAWDPAALAADIDAAFGNMPEMLETLWTEAEREAATQAFTVEQGTLPDLKPGGPETNVLSFTLTPEQLGTVKAALDKAKEDLGGGKPAACLEHLSKKFLGGGQ